jgi:hypothetical protein
MEVKCKMELQELLSVRGLQRQAIPDAQGFPSANSPHALSVLEGGGDWGAAARTYRDVASA